MSRALAPFFYLRKDEVVLRKERAAPGHGVLWFLGLAAPVSLLAAAGLVALRLGPPVPVRPAWILAAWTALVVVAALVAWRRWATTEYVLTDQRIYARTGRFVTRVHFATHDKVTDVRYRQGPLERLAGASGLTFSTAGGDVRLAGLVDALAMKEDAERARDAFIQRLLENARFELPAPAAGGTAADASGTAPSDAEVSPDGSVAGWAGARPDYVKRGDAPQWNAKPTLLSALGLLPSFAAAFVFLLVSESARRAAPFVLPLVVLAALVLLGARVLALRRTEYVATDRRVYARSGIVGTTVKQLTYDKITDITYRQDLLGRLLGYGTVTLATAGGSGGAVHLHGLARPLAAKETVEALRARYLREADA